LLVAFESWLKVSCNDPIPLSLGEIENLEGLGGIGIRCGLAGIFSGAGFASQEEAESTARTKLITCEV